MKKASENKLKLTKINMCVLSNTIDLKLDCSNENLQFFLNYQAKTRPFLSFRSPWVTEAIMVWNVNYLREVVWHPTYLQKWCI